MRGGVVERSARREGQHRERRADAGPQWRSCVVAARGEREGREGHEGEREGRARLPRGARGRASRASALLVRAEAQDATEIPREARLVTGRRAVRIDGTTRLVEPPRRGGFDGDARER